MIEITIPNWRPTSLNKLMRMHWAARNKLVKADKALIAAYSIGKPKAEGKRRVSLHIVLSGRQRATDPDNNHKLINDGLVSCGMLVDDTVEFVEIGTVAFSRGNVTETIIKLEDL
jgi:hypothetical protein